MFQKKPLLTQLFSCLKLNQTAISLIDSDSKSHVSSDVDGSFQEQNVSDMDITNLSMEVVHHFKNPSTNSVNTFLSVDKLYELLLHRPLRILIPVSPYSMSTCNSSYKKRVTWFNSEPVIATAIVEYIGEYVPNVVHGNA